MHDVGLHLCVDGVEPFLHDDVVTKWSENFVVRERLSLVDFSFLQKAGTIMFIDGLKYLLEGEIVIGGVLDITASEESDALGVQLVCLLNGLEHPFIRVTVQTDHTDVMLWAGGANMEEEFLQITPGLVRLLHVKDLVGTLSFHDVDASGVVHGETGP